MAVDKRRLVAASSNGLVRIFNSCSYEQRSEIELCASLPPQEMSLAHDLLFVAGKRMLFIVDIEAPVVLQRLSMCFAARPGITTVNDSIYVRCDEVVCMWHLEMKDSGCDTVPMSSDPPKANEFRRLHCQLMIGGTTDAPRTLCGRAAGALRHPDQRARDHGPRSCHGLCCDHVLVHVLVHVHSLC